MLNRSLYTTTSPLDAASFYIPKTDTDSQRLRAGTETRLAAGTAVSGRGTAPSGLGAAVTESGTLAGLLAGSTASGVSRDLLSGGRSSSGLGGGGSLGSGRRATCAKAGLAASTAVSAGGAAPTSLGAAVSEG